ncbi:MAG: hypothetical protein E5V48_00870, partial [Mesorhizobium sp.]
MLPGPKGSGSLIRGCGARASASFDEFARMSFEGPPSEPWHRGQGLADIGKDIERPLGQSVRAPRAAGKV